MRKNEKRLVLDLWLLSVKLYQFRTSHASSFEKKKITTLHLKRDKVSHFELSSIYPNLKAPMESFQLEMPNFTQFDNNYVRKLLRHLVILSVDINNQRILQSNWSRQHWWSNSTFCVYNKWDFHFLRYFLSPSILQITQIHFWEVLRNLGVVKQGWTHRT